MNPGSLCSSSKNTLKAALTGNNYGTANHSCDDYDELLSNLNSGSIAVEVSIFYNSAAAVVNEFDDIALGVVEVIGVERWVLTGIHNYFPPYILKGITIDASIIK